MYSNSYSIDSTSNAAVNEGALAILMAFLAAYFIFILAIYVYMAFSMMKIAQKTGTPNGWMAWIPIANMVLLLQISRKPVWWIILAFIPIVNLSWIVLGIIVWMAIAERLGKPNWLGILMIVPILNLVIPGYLAFSKTEIIAQTPPINPITPAASPFA